jgi:hypothetical protein
MFAVQKLMLCVVAVACLACLAGEALCGPVNGRKYDVHRVEAYSTDRFHVSFFGDQDAAVIISGDGDTDLDLYVYDENGNLIGSDTDSSDDCVVRFHPRWTGSFRIEVRNLGRVYNQYQIACL